jgi:hypothetical protein
MRGDVKEDTRVVNAKALALLGLAEKQIKNCGEISEKLEGQLFEADPALREALPKIEQTVALVLEWDSAKIAQLMGVEESPTDLKPLRACLIKKMAVQCLEMRNREFIDSIVNLSCGQKSIPHRDAVDRISRYEAAAERSLSKALDRLETLQQRRRRGEALPPRLERER